MDFMFWIWLAVIIVAIIIEALTFDLISVWFAFGSIPSLIMAITNGVRWEIQVAVFIAVSAVLILSLRNLTKKWLLRNAKEKTNIDALIGKNYKLLTEITADTSGTVKINGVVWSCVEAKSKAIEAGKCVKIVKIDGNKLVVEENEEKGEN